MENTFAATLPLESLKYILSQFQMLKRGPSQLPRGKWKIVVLDVPSAHPSQESKGVVHTVTDRRKQAGTRDAANAPWRHGDDLVFQGDELLKGLGSVMILKRQQAMTNM